MSCGISPASNCAVKIACSANASITFSHCASLSAETRIVTLYGLGREPCTRAEMPPLVSSIERSLPFYRELLGPLGWHGISEVEGERGETIWYLPGRDTAIGLRGAQTAGGADRCRDALRRRAPLGQHPDRGDHRCRVGPAIQGRQSDPDPPHPPRPGQRTRRLRQPQGPPPPQELRHRQCRLGTGTHLSPRYRNLTWA